MIRISFVSGVCLLPDAISYSLVCKIQALRLLYGAGFEYRVFSYASNLQDRNVLIVSGMTELVMHPFFLASDLVCYEFGIYYNLFDSIYLLPARIKRLAIYHNITPENLMDSEDRKAAVRRGLQQRANLFFCDHVAADSAYNREDLIQYGLPPSKVDVLNLPVDEAYCPAPSFMPPVTPYVEVLFVGRFVPAKGVLDLVEAVTRLVSRKDCKLRLSLIGDTTFSDHSYINRVNEAIAASGFPASFRFVGSASPAELVRYYREAHILAIPSYHEGYCLPVLEAMSSGCLVVGYNAANLPCIASGLGRLVPAGDVRALADAIGDLARSLLLQRGERDNCQIRLDSGTMTIAQYRAKTTEYLQRFTSAKFAETFGRVLSQKMGVSIN